MDEKQRKRGLDLFCRLKFVTEWDFEASFLRLFFFFVGFVVNTWGDGVGTFGKGVAGAAGEGEVIFFWKNV